MFDLVIIGAGPAGLTALLYATLYGLQTICIGDTIGGKLLQAPNILDYPGFASVSGKELATLFIKQVEQIRAIVRQGEIIHLRKKTQQKVTIFTTYVSGEEKYVSKTILFATGNSNKQTSPKAPRLAESLGVKQDNGFFIVDHHGKTNVPGVFAAGDCVVFPYSLEQITTATSTAIQATIGVYEYLKGSTPPIVWGTSKIPRT